MTSRQEILHALPHHPKGSIKENQKYGDGYRLETKKKSNIHYLRSIFGKDTDVSLSLCLLSLFGFKEKKSLERWIFSL